MFHKICFAIVSSLLLSTATFAINLNLYDQPKSDSKVTGKIDSEVGIIPIFTPKDSEWVKVADPRNGNVGWIKSSDLKTSNASGGNFSFRIINTGSSPNGYQIIQFGTPQPFSKEQAEGVMKNIELKQEEFQKGVQKMMQNLFNPGAAPTAVPQQAQQIPIAQPKPENPVKK